MDSGVLSDKELISREKHRWGDGRNVYTRKIRRLTTATTTTPSNNTNNQNHYGRNVYTRKIRRLTTATTPTTTPSNNTNNQNHIGRNVYTRKIRRLTTAAATTTTTTTTTSNNTKNQNQKVSQPQGVVPNRGEASGSGGVNGLVVKPLVAWVEDRVRINLGAVGRPKDEIKELMRKLGSELEQVRSLVQKLEAKEIELSGFNTTTVGGFVSGGGYSHSQYSGNEIQERREFVRVNSDMGSVGHHDSRHSGQLSLPERRELGRAYSEVGSLGHHESRPSGQLSVHEGTELVRVNSEVGSVGQQDSRPSAQLDGQERRELVRVNSELGLMGHHDSRPSKQSSVPERRELVNSEVGAMGNHDSRPSGQPSFQESRELVRVNSEVGSMGHHVQERRELVQVNSEMGSVGHHDSRLSGQLSVQERRDLVRVNSELGSQGHHDSGPAGQLGVQERRELLRVNSVVGSMGHHDSRPPGQLSVRVIENNYNHGLGGEFIEKEKRTPKANQYYWNSDFLIGKDRLPPESNKKLKSNGGKKHGRGMDYGFGIDRNRTQVFRACINLLQRLMKHKHGWVFNEPVNAKTLGLHDYHVIIKHPMDLGTIRNRLAQNWYKSPREFAEDVRLTFRNAMTYNPKGQDVHTMAEQLSMFFEARWAVIETEYNPIWRFQMYHDAGLPSPFSRKVPTVPQLRTWDRSESMTVTVDPKIKPLTYAPVVRTPAPKKPKAKDPNKRDMTFEEKRKLSANLQSLPSEKLDAIVQIIKKRTSSLRQHDDEIEVDIDSVDTETLWELDRLVTNYKKNLSKNKRKAEIALQRRVEAGHANPASNPAPAVVEAPNEIRTDERNVASASPVQREQQGDDASRSSSSSSSSSDSGSSSSDSGSNSSSAYGSSVGHSPRT